MRQKNPGCDYHQKVSGDGTLLADYAVIPDGAKAVKFVSIDDCTAFLISAGFVWAGKTFSLSVAAQLNWSSMASDPSALTYPHTASTIDDLDSHAFEDEAEIAAAALVATGTRTAHVASGTALKDLVRAATTVAEVEAIEDSR